MLLTEILTSDRIHVGPELASGSDVLVQLAELLGAESGEQPSILGRLKEREALQSTGIGDGVAIPHTAIDTLQSQRAALVLCPQGVDFASIDGLPVYIFFGVIGPKSETSTHLKILAKISRLLRSPETRRRLLESQGPSQAYSLIEEQESSSISS